MSAWNECCILFSVLVNGNDVKVLENHLNDYHYDTRIREAIMRSVIFFIMTIKLPQYLKLLCPSTPGYAAPSRVIPTGRPPLSRRAGVEGSLRDSSPAPSPAGARANHRRAWRTATCRQIPRLPPEHQSVARNDSQGPDPRHSHGKCSSEVLHSILS